MTIAIMGAGGVGCYYGAMLARWENEAVADEPEWNVDCEYDRGGTERKLAPTTPSRPSGNGIPDLVVHRRNGDGLVACEFKLDYSSLSANSDDAQKIEYWVERYDYALGAVIGFGPDKRSARPKVIWRRSGRWTHPELLLDPEAVSG